MSIKKYLSLLLAVAFMGIVSCDVLDIEPEQSVSDDIIFDDVSGARGAVTGMYGAVRFGNAYGGFPLMAADFRADNSEHIGSFTTWEQARRYNIAVTNSTVEGVWNSNYTAINRANHVIEFVADVEDVSEDLAENWVGQGYFVRAISHFNLVRWFGQPYGFTGDNSHLGVPIITEPTTDPFDHEVPRSTVSEVYDQIIRDLENAMQRVPEEHGSASDTRGRATQGSVRGFLARVYLHMGEYDLAAEYANDVIQSDLYSLQPNFDFFDTKNTSEDVFAIQMTTEDNPGVNAAMAALHMPTPIGRGDINPTDDLLNAYEEGDLRKSELLFDSEIGDGGTTWSSKYTLEDNSDNVHVMRIAEMKLTRAEALTESNQDIEPEAVELLNDVRTRAGLDEFEEGDFADHEELIDAILHERRVELAFEGHRKWDLLRKGRDITNIPSGQVESVPYGDNDLIFPIPQREMDVNEELVQNDGYGS